MNRLVAQLKRRGEEALAANYVPPRRYGTAFHLSPPANDLRQLLVTREHKNGGTNINQLARNVMAQLEKLDLTDPYLAWLVANIDQVPAQFIRVPAGQTVQQYRQGPGLDLIVLEAGSSLMLHDLIMQEEMAIHRLIVWQKEQSSLRYVSLRGLNDWLTDELKIELVGRAAATEVTQLNYGSGGEQADISASVWHRAWATTSRLQVRAAGSGQSTTIYRGLIDVDETARGAVGWQGGRALLLSRQATVDVLPRLDIRTNDVRCSHGVNAAHLDEVALFYMNTRGLTARQARRLALLGFFTQQLRLSRLLASKLRHIVRCNERIYSSKDSPG